jgi:hypothetical protein
MKFLLTFILLVTLCSLTFASIPTINCKSVSALEMDEDFTLEAELLEEDCESIPVCENKCSTFIGGCTRTTYLRLDHLAKSNSYFANAFKNACLNSDFDHNTINKIQTQDALSREYKKIVIEITGCDFQGHEKNSFDCVNVCPLDFLNSLAPITNWTFNSCFILF